MQLNINPKSIFTYDRTDNSIHIHTMRDNKYGIGSDHNGSIKFASNVQAGQFAEMLELMLRE